MEKPAAVLSIKDIVSVSFVSELLKNVVETAFARIKVRGEISGCTRHSSGHIYLDLKEKSGGRDFILSGIIWKWTKLSVIPENGMEVIATGKITTYSGRSSYQLTIEDMELEGQGILLKQIEERRKKLDAEGLFDPARKKRIPFLPQKIGVATSPTGAVIRDILHRLSERFPVEVIVWPCAVQGEGAENSIVSAIQGLNALPIKPDVIIVARGGGSLQDLMPFNEESVVRAIANSAIPIISAIGHETDTTLSDFAADLRAPTPTAAAEKAVPVRADLIEMLGLKEKNLWRNLINLLAIKKLNLEKAKLRTPLNVVEDYLRRIDDMTTRLTEKITYKLERLVQQNSHMGQLLESYSFKKVLKRGFSIARAEKTIVSSSEQAIKTPPTHLIFHDGEIKL